MKQKYFSFFVVIVIIALAITVTTVLGRASDNNKIYFTENLEESSNTTFIAAPANLKTLVTTYTFKNRDLNQQAEESTIIIKGRVLEILDTVETQDIVDLVMAERIAQGWKYLHTDVLFHVDEYLGPNSLPLDKLVLRHIGGKIEGQTAHICEQEHLTVGEEIIIFRLTKPEDMTQVPEGYSLEQYYLFQPASKYMSIEGNNYRASFKNETVDITQIKKASRRAKPTN